MTDDIGLEWQVGILENYAGSLFQVLEISQLQTRVSRRQCGGITHPTFAEPVFNFIACRQKLS